MDNYSSSNVVVLAAARATESGKVTPPRRRPNKHTRARDYLREEEVERMVAAADRGRYPLRDQLIILLSFRHGLRSAELVDLQWSDVDWKHGRLHVRRLKGSLDAVHPLSGRETRLLKRHKPKQPGKWIFETERGGPLSTRLVRHVVAEAGRAARIAFPVNTHALRHGCGYWLSERGMDLRMIQAYLGHANVQNAQRYVALNSERFNGFYWRD